MEFSKDKSNLIKIISFCMTCFMCFYHTGAHQESIAINMFDERLNVFLSHFFDSMGVIAMSYFFAVTAFLLFNNLTFNSYKKKIYKSFFSLLIPYVLWQIIFAIKMAVLGNQISLVTFLKRSFGFICWPVDGAMWYVYAVFIMAAFSPILLVLFFNKEIAFETLIIIFVLLNARDAFTNAYIVKIMTWGYVPNILFYLPAFLMGAFYGKFHNEIKEEHSLLYILLILFVAFMIEGTWGETIKPTLILMLPILFLFQLPVLPQLIDLNIYKLSFLMYAIHQPLIGDIIGPVNSFYTYFRIPASLENILTRFIILLVDITIAKLIYITLNKVCPKLLELLCGGRVSNIR